MVAAYPTIKSIQAAAVLLREHGGQMSRLRLAKLLYIANRESLVETLRPITSDRALALDHGPVPSAVYDLLRREHVDAPLWDEFIQYVGPQDHRLIQDPGVAELSRYEIEKLRKIAESRREKNDYDIALESQQFGEWTRNQPGKGQRKWISFDDLITALHLEPSKQRIEQAAADDAAFDEALELVKKVKQNAQVPAVA